MARYGAEYADKFGLPKIIFQIFQVRSSFAFDRLGAIVNNSVYMIPHEDYFLLGVLTLILFGLKSRETALEFKTATN